LLLAPFNGVGLGRRSSVGVEDDASRDLSLQAPLGGKFRAVGLWLELGLAVQERVALSRSMDMVETVELLVAAHIMVERLLAWALGQIVELLLVAQNLPQLLLPFREGRTGTGLLLMLVLWLLLAYTSD